MTGPTLRSWLQVREAFDVAMVPSFLGVFAHAGAMGALQREGLLREVVGYSGSSAGAQCGAILASGKQILADQNKSEDVSVLLHPDMNRLTSLGDRRWQVLDFGAGLGIFTGEGIEHEMSHLMHPDFTSL
jgi:predicted acylesterase/phospholipase RssA